MKVRFTVHSYFEVEIPGDDFDQAVKDIRAEPDKFIATAERTKVGVDFVEEVSERVETP